MVLDKSEPKLDYDPVSGGMEQALLTTVRQFAAGTDDARPSPDTIDLAEQATRLAYSLQESPTVAFLSNGELGIMVMTGYRRTDICIMSTIAADGSAMLSHTTRKETAPLDRYQVLWDWERLTTAQHLVDLLNQPAKNLTRALPQY